MPPTNTRSLMKDFRASFRRKKVVDTAKSDKVKQQEEDSLTKLAELKELVSEYLPSRYKDADLLGFLKARLFNIKEAEKLLKLDISLRKFLQLEDFVNNYRLTELDESYRVSTIIGSDKEGSLVRVLNFGLADLKGSIQALSTIENFRILLWFLEKDLQLQEEENKKTGKTNRQLTYIINVDGLSMSKITHKPALDSAMQAVKLFQDHYNDVPKMVYLVNAPSFFSSVFKLFKPVIGEFLHQRIRIFENNGQEELLKVIDADILPACFGGKRTDSDGDPNCLNLIGKGGKIPEKYFTSTSLCPDDPDVTSATVPAGSSLNFRFNVPQKGSRLFWHIQSKDNDISIGVFLQPEEDDDCQPLEKQKKKKEDIDMSRLEQLTPIIRTQCHITPEIGSTVLWFQGTGILHFDNSYSWMSSKDVMFKVLVEPPAEKENNVNSLNCKQNSE